MGSSSKRQTVGYRYLAGIHMGVCRGPVDELVEIQVGERTAWSGSVTESSRIYIDAPDLFGGDDSEGGIQGYLDVMMGEPTQGLNSRLAAMLTGIVPAFRGVFTLFYDGLVSALNPYPKPWAMRARRAVRGWQDDAAWYPERAVIWMAEGQVRAMNPAHILVQANTDDDWGRGLAREQLDLASYQAAADKLHIESFGLCLRYNRQERVSVFIQTVLDHIGAAQYVSRTTGLLTLRLIRDDYDVATLPTFSLSTGLLGIDEDEVSAVDTATNEVIVNWRDPVVRKVRQSRERNLGAIRAAGGVNTTTTEYPGVPTADLAHRVAARDVLVASTSVRRYKVRLDRRGYALEPGAPFVVSAPAQGIAQIVLRAGEIDYGTLTEGTITVTAVQDVFGLPATGLYAVEPGLWTPPARTPYPMTVRRVYEMTLRDMYRLAASPDNLEGVPPDMGNDPTGGIVQAVGARPPGVPYSYLLQARVAPAEFADVETGDFCPTAVLRYAVEPGSTLLWLADDVDLERVAAGSAALLGNEICRVVSINLEGPGAPSMQVARACIDTVPVKHTVGTRLFCYQDFETGPYTRYSLATTIQARMLTNTSTSQLAPALAPVDDYQVIARDARPYPPGQVTVNGQSYPAEVVSDTGDFVFAWAHRDRHAQADILVDCTEGNIGPEAGVRYDLVIYRQADDLEVAAVRDIDGTSATINGAALPLSETAAAGVPLISFDDVPPNSAELGAAWSLSSAADWRTASWRAEHADGWHIPLADGPENARTAILRVVTAAGGQLDFDYRFVSWRAQLEVLTDTGSILQLGGDDYRQPQAGHVVVQIPAGEVFVLFRYYNPADGFEEVEPTWISGVVLTSAGDVDQANGIALHAELAGDVVEDVAAWSMAVTRDAGQHLALRGAAGAGVVKWLELSLGAAVMGTLQFFHAVDLYSGSLRVLIGGREVWARRVEDGRLTDSGNVSLAVPLGAGTIRWEYENSADGQADQPPGGTWIDAVRVQAAQGYIIVPCRAELSSKRPHVEMVGAEEVTTWISSYQHVETLLSGAVRADQLALMDLVTFRYGGAAITNVRSIYPAGTGSAALAAFDAIASAVGTDGIYTTGNPAALVAFTSQYVSSHVPPALPLLSGIVGTSTTISIPAGAYALSGSRVMAVVFFGAGSVVSGLYIALEGDTPWTAAQMRAQFKSIAYNGGTDAVGLLEEVQFSERLRLGSRPGLVSGLSVYVARGLPAGQASAFSAALAAHQEYEVRITV